MNGGKGREGERREGGREEEREGNLALDEARNEARN